MEIGIYIADIDLPPPDQGSGWIDLERDITPDGVHPK